MRLATIKRTDRETAALVLPQGVVPIESINYKLQTDWATDLFALIQSGQLSDMNRWYRSHEERLHVDLSQDIIPHDAVVYGPLYRHPRKIWGIGLNYVEHAADLHEQAPNTEPASFMKPDTAIIGPGEPIHIPLQSNRTTAEAELGIIIGKTCKDVSEAEAPGVIAGYTSILDMTAEDILQVNPRYLTRAKSFDTFFSFGPHLVTPDEVEQVLDLQVATVINEQIHRQNVVSNMTFRPWNLVSFHSKVMTLLPGDIISTGTPGAVIIRDGDIVECRIDGFAGLSNPVRDLKNNSQPLGGRE